LAAGVTDISIEPLANGWFTVSEREHRWRVAAAIDGTRIWVFVDGHVSVFDTRPAGVRSRERASSTDVVMAPMPATVAAVNVVVGQMVKAGDTLLVLEAMKMEMPIRAPRDGGIKSVSCRAGELVQPGIILVEFL
jgi:biotin carboxyl carrier protein